MKKILGVVVTIECRQCHGEKRVPSGKDTLRLLVTCPTCGGIGVEKEAISIDDFKKELMKPPRDGTVTAAVLQTLKSAPLGVWLTASEIAQVVGAVTTTVTTALANLEVGDRVEVRRDIRPYQYRAGRGA